MYRADHLKNEQALHDTSETCKAAECNLYCYQQMPASYKLEHKMAPRDHHNLTLQGCSV